MDLHGDHLLPPPPITSDVQPVKAGSDKGSPSRSPPVNGQAQPSKPKRILAARPGLATRGQKINLLYNLYRVNVKGTSDYFHHYSAS